VTLRAMNVDFDFSVNSFLRFDSFKLEYSRLPWLIFWGNEGSGL